MRTGLDETPRWDRVKRDLPGSVGRDGTHLGTAAAVRTGPVAAIAPAPPPRTCRPRLRDSGARDPPPPAAVVGVRPCPRRRIGRPDGGGGGRRIGGFDRGRTSRDDDGRRPRARDGQRCCGRFRRWRVRRRRVRRGRFRCRRVRRRHGAGTATGVDVGSSSDGDVDVVVTSSVGGSDDLVGVVRVVVGRGVILGADDAGGP
jgi:hypothetical protein